MKHRIPTPTASQRKIPISGEPSKPKLWAFSFRFWLQTELFPLSSRPAWFSSLLSRLRELSGIPVEEFKGSPKTQAWHRYHDIDWTAKNIPLQRSDMTWIPLDYRDNETEFPLMQFHISKAVGRVIGFWDEHDIFNIVALDSLHNLQPSARYDYAVRKGVPIQCDYTSLLKDIELAQGQQCNVLECLLRIAVHKLPRDEHNHEVSIIRLDPGTLEMVAQLERKGISVRDIFESGILFETNKVEGQRQPD